MNRRFKRIVLAVVASVIFGSLAQTGLAQIGADQVITGSIVDQAGASLTDVKITVVDSSTGIKTETLSNSEGLYRTPPLIPGRYEITATKEGFQTLVHTGITLHLAEVLRLDLQLKIGSISQHVDVTGDAPMLETNDGRISDTITEKAVESLPLLDRRAGGLLGLTAGVYYEGQDPQSFYAPRFNIGSTDAAVITIDNAPANADRIDVTGQMSSPNPPLEAMEEVQVQTHYSGAEYGGAEGGIVRMVTKSGTNGFHGALYEYDRNQLFDTRSFFAPTKAADRYDLFGGTIGGPIKKNRAFFFVSAEGTRQNLPTSGVFTLPTVAERNGDFSALGVPIYDPATTRPDPNHPGQFIRDPFPGNIIPAGRIDPVALAAMSFYPDVTTPGPNNYDASLHNLIDRYAWTAKLDYKIGEKDQLSYTWLYDRTTMTTGGLVGFKDPAAEPWSQAASFPYKMQSHGITEVHTFSPSWMNFARFDFRPRWWNDTEPGLNPSKHWAATLGLNNTASDIVFPPFNVAGYMSLGPSVANFGQNPVNETEFSDTLVHMSGKHTIKFGFEVQRARHAIDYALEPNGLYNFSPAETANPQNPTTGDAAASFLIGAVDSANVYDTGPLSYHEWYASPYLSDNVHVTRKLTLDFGLRWDLDFPIYEDVANKVNGFNPYQINPVSGTPGVVTFLGRDGLGRGIYNIDWGRISPRVGFAYSPDDKTAVRGGYGIYSIPPALLQLFPPPTLGVALANASFVTVDNGLTPAFQLQDGLPAWQRGGTPQVLTPGFGAVPVGQPPVSNVSFIDPNWKFGYLEDMNLSVERQLPGQMVFELAGLSQLGRKLSLSGGQYGGFDENQVPAALWGSTGNAQILRPFPQFGSVVNAKAAKGTTDYYGLTAKLTKRVSHGLLVYSSFTWQKTLGTMAYDADSDPRLSRGPTVFNEANGPAGMPYKLFKLAWAYDLPAGPGKSHLNSGPLSWVLGGWNVGGIWTWYGGLPFSLTSSAANSLNCFCPAGQRLDKIGDLKVPDPSINEWFNTAAVAIPAFGTVGTLGPGSLTGPEMKNLDLALSRVYSKDRYSVKFSAEAFNLTNTPKFGLPDTVFGDPGFGKITQYRGLGANGGFDVAPWYGARIMQLGLRIGW